MREQQFAAHNLMGSERRVSTSGGQELKMAKKRNTEAPDLSAALADITFGVTKALEAAIHGATNKLAVPLARLQMAINGIDAVTEPKSLLDVGAQALALIGARVGASRAEVLDAVECAVARVESRKGKAR